MLKGLGFLIVFDLTNRSTFAGIGAFREQILRVKDQNTWPMVLAGNKVDIAVPGRRQIETQEAMTLAASWGVPYFETSAKTTYNVTQAWLQVGRRWLGSGSGGGGGVARLTCVGGVSLCASSSLQVVREIRASPLTNGTSPTSTVVVRSHGRCTIL